MIFRENTYNAAIRCFQRSSLFPRFSDNRHTNVLISASRELRELIADAAIDQAESFIAQCNSTIRPKATIKWKSFIPGSLDLADLLCLRFDISKVIKILSKVVAMEQSE